MPPEAEINLNQTLGTSVTMTLVFILTFSLLNRLRGYNPVEDFQHQHGISYDAAYKACEAWKRWVAFGTSDGFFGIYAGLITAGYGLWLGYGWQHSGLIFLLVAIGLQIWSRPSWQRQFAAIHGKWEGKSGILSVFTERVVSSPVKRGILYGGLRGFCGLLPLAVGFVLLGHGYTGASLAVAGILQGVSYWLGGKITPRSVIGGELIMGALIGVAVGEIWT